MLPNRLVVATYVKRQVRLWALCRVAVSGVLLLVGTDPLRLSPLTLCAVVVLAAVVSTVELHVRRERDLLGNLGVGPLALGLLLLAPPMADELTIRAVAAFIA